MENYFGMPPDYFGIPTENFTSSPSSNLKPNLKPNRYRNSDYYQKNAKTYLEPYIHPYPYYNPNSRSCQHRKPPHNPNFNRQETSNPTLKPRAASVPIPDDFLNSDSGASRLPTQTQSPMIPPRPSPKMAAVKLQKVIRGFLVRKNWSIVQKIEAEAEAIGEEIARDEMILEKEVKDRIRFGETLMRLLFRLDSVRGVRDYRKKVIRKVISLQELVDSIGARGDKVESDTIEVDRSYVVVDSVEFTAQNPNSPQTEEDKVVKAVDSMDDTPIGVVDSMKESPIEPMKSTETSQMEISDDKSNGDQEFTEAQDSTETPQMEILDGILNVDEECTQAQQLDEVCDPAETLEMEEIVKRSNAVDEAPESCQAVTCNNENNEMKLKGVKDVMERMVVESDKMKSLMEELCQCSARQRQLMEGLVDRVQRLEREAEKM